MDEQLIIPLAETFPNNATRSRRDITPLQKRRFDIKMTTVFGALNNLLETTTILQQRPGNALVTTIPKTNSRDFLRHRLHEIDKNSQKSSKYQKT